MCYMIVGLYISVLEAGEQIPTWQPFWADVEKQNFQFAQLCLNFFRQLSLPLITE